MKLRKHEEFLPRGDQPRTARLKMGRLSMSWLTGIHVITSDDAFPRQTNTLSTLSTVSNGLDVGTEGTLDRGLGSDEFSWKKNQGNCDS